MQLRLHARRHERAMPLFDLGLDDTAYPYLLFLSQAETERILQQHVTTAGITVERGVELVDLTNTSETVTAVLRHADDREERLSARYVVGCDGAHSTVRCAAGIAFEGNAYPQTFVLADVEADGIETGAAHVFLSSHGILFFFPLGAPTSWRLLAMRPPTDPTPPEAPVTLAEAQALADTYTQASVRLWDPVWMANFQLHHRRAARYRAGRVFLAGDAAHIHSPAGAQGMNTGIQDATNLGWKLAYTLRGLTNTTVLDSYESERAPVGRVVLRFTDRAYNHRHLDQSGPAFRPRPSRLRADPTRVEGQDRPGVRVPNRVPVGHPLPAQRAVPERATSTAAAPAPAIGCPTRRSSTMDRSAAYTRPWPRLAGTWLLCGESDTWLIDPTTRPGRLHAGVITTHHVSPNNTANAMHDP